MQAMKSPASHHRILLVRHTEIDQNFKGICYGQTDVSLSSSGIEALAPLAKHLRAQNPSQIFHSGKQRTRCLADLLAKLMTQEGASIPTRQDKRLAELNFGNWECQTWDAIYAEHGDDIGRLVTEPETFAPPGGETVFQLRDRMLNWYNGLPSEGIIVAITHGGPISALLGTLSASPAYDWPNLVPAYGTVTPIK